MKYKAKDMSRFLQLFTFVFMLSIFVGVFHEITTDHVHGEKCEVCLVAHSPAILVDKVSISSIEVYFEDYCVSVLAPFYQAKIFIRNRSPPLF